MECTDVMPGDLDQSPSRHRLAAVDAAGRQLLREGSLKLLDGSEKWEQKYAGFRIAEALLGNGDDDDQEYAVLLMDRCCANLEVRERLTSHGVALRFTRA